MKGVVDHIDVRAIGKNRWKLLNDFEWHGIVVPENFETDFGSIPSLIRPFINPVGELRPGYLVHDWLYHLRGELEEPIIRNDIEKTVLTREESDIELLSVAEIIHYNIIKRRMVFRAVRMFGWIAWNK